LSSDVLFNCSKKLVAARTTSRNALDQNFFGSTFSSQFLLMFFKFKFASKIVINFRKWLQLFHWVTYFQVNCWPEWVKRFPSFKETNTGLL